MANTAPVLGGYLNAYYAAGAGSIVFADVATVADADSADFNGGSLTVHFTTGLPEDQLTIAAAGGITLSGSEVRYNGAAIGSWSGGVNGADLVVGFNSADATPAAAQALVRALRYASNLPLPDTRGRAGAITLIDGDGGADTATTNFQLRIQNLYLPSAVTVGPGAQAIAGVYIDYDESDPTLRYTLQISTSGGDAKVVVNGAPAGGTAFDLYGTMAELNALLATLTYTGNGQTSDTIGFGLYSDDGVVEELRGVNVTINMPVIPKEVVQHGPITVLEGQAASIAGLFTTTYPAGFFLPNLSLTPSAGAVGFQPSGPNNLTVSVSGGVLSVPSNSTSPNEIDLLLSGARGGLTYTYAGDAPPASVTITAAYAGVSTAIATINITPVNDAPTTQAKATTLAATSYTFQASDFAFADVDGGILTAVVLASLPTLSGAVRLNGGAVAINQAVAIADIAAGKLTFSPGAAGLSTFEFKVRDDGGTANGGQDTSTAATFSLTTPAEFAPPPPSVPTGAPLQPPPPSQAPVVSADFSNLLRFQTYSTAPLPPTVTTPDGRVLPNPLLEQQKAVKELVAKVDAGQLTLRQAQDIIVDMADGATSVATLTYQFFTGRLPTREGLDWLVSSPDNPNDLNDGYYAGMSLENRYINFAVNLGREGEGQAAFATNYGQLTLTDATAKAYGEIFGPAPPGKVEAILTPERVAYFNALGGDALGAKAAMVGFLLGEAAKSDLGPYAANNENFLYDLLDGTAAFGANAGIYVGAGPTSVGLLGLG